MEAARREKIAVVHVLSFGFIVSNDDDCRQNLLPFFGKNLSFFQTPEDLSETANGPVDLRALAVTPRARCATTPTLPFTDAL